MRLRQVFLAVAFRSQLRRYEKIRRTFWADSKISRVSPSIYEPSSKSRGSILWSIASSNSKEMMRGESTRMRKRQADIAWGIFVAIALIAIRLWQSGDVPSPGIFMYFAGGIIIGTVLCSKFLQSHHPTSARVARWIFAAGSLTCFVPIFLFIDDLFNVMHIKGLILRIWITEVLLPVLIVVLGIFCVTLYTVRAQRRIKDGQHEVSTATIPYEFSLLMLAGFCQAISQIFSEHWSAGYCVLSVIATFFAVCILLYCLTPFEQSPENTILHEKVEIEYELGQVIQKFGLFA